MIIIPISLRGVEVLGLQRMKTSTFSIDAINLFFKISSDSFLGSINFSWV